MPLPLRYSPLARAPLGAALAVIGWLGCVGSYAATPDDQVVWTIDQTILRTDATVVWQSPTTIRDDLAAYEFTYEVTGVSAIYGGFIQPQDIESLVAGSYDPLGAGSFVSLPALLTEETIADAATGTSFDLRFEVEPDGSGRAVVSDIALGQIPTDFGTQLVDIDALQIEATVTVSGFADLPGDYDNDGDVDGDDYLLWQLSYGSTALLLADGNGDGVVNAADYTVWRDAAPATQATGVPEPAAALCVLVLLAVVPRVTRVR